MEYHLKVDKDQSSIVDLLSATTFLSKQIIKQAMQKGAVWLSNEYGTQRVRRHTRKLQVGWEIHFYYNPEILEKTVEPAELIADEKSYSVWRKPYGMLSQGAKWGDHCTLYRWAEQHLQPERPAFIVHRLDRAASGLMMVAHTKSMAAKLSKMFADRKIVKRYSAVVKGHFDVKTIKREYATLMPYNTKLKITQSIDSKEACSFIELAKYDPDKDVSTLNVEIETGRKHQVRKHLAELGYPIIGDRLYGQSDEIELPDLQLTAYYLAFECPETYEQKEWQLDLLR